MSNSIISPKVQRHFHLGPWFLVCAFKPLISNQTFNFLQFDPLFSQFQSLQSHVFFQFGPWYLIS